MDNSETHYKQIDKDKETILKAATEKLLIMCMKTYMRLSLDFSAEIYRLEGSRMIYLKCINKRKTSHEHCIWEIVLMWNKIVTISYTHSIFSQKHFPPICLASEINLQDICNHCVLSTVCCGGLLEANRSEFFCTYVRVLEVLFKIKCCGKGSILFFRSVIFHYYVWHGYNKNFYKLVFQFFLMNLEILKKKKTS